MELKVTIPPNVSRHNEYVEFDRGLFITGDSQRPVGRVYDATYITYGDMTDYGVLDYRLEFFSQVPTTVDQLTTYSLGVGPTTYRALTRTLCDKPIMIEAFALQHFTNGATVPTPAVIQETTESAMNMVIQLSKDVMKELQTTLEFTCTPTTPLAISSATISYFAKVGETVLQNTITPPLDKISPLQAALADIRAQLSAQ